MEILTPGHRYKLEHLDGNDYERLRFVDRGHGNDNPGTNNQEVLRVLIDRVRKGTPLGW